MTVVVVAGGAMEADDEGAVPPVAAVVVVTFMTTGLAAAAWGAGVGVSVDSAGVPATCTCSALVFPVCTVSALLGLNASLRARRLLPSELSHLLLSRPHLLAGCAGSVRLPTLQRQFGLGGEPLCDLGVQQLAVRCGKVSSRLLVSAAIAAA